MVRVGIISLDVDDVQMLINDGQFGAVIVHEFCHILGFGSVWEIGHALVGGLSPSLYYQGASGNAANEALGFKGKAVIEAGGGSGTARSHWDDLTYRNEIMTGYISSTNPLSALTIQSLVDLGYDVDPTQADDYSAATRNLRSSSSDTAATVSGEGVGDVVAEERGSSSKRRHYGDDMFRLKVLGEVKTVERHKSKAKKKAAKTKKSKSKSKKGGGARRLRVLFP